jgi:hypothetical protein
LQLAALQLSAKGPSRRIKRRDLKEEEVEAETARLVGLNPFQLEEEEQAMLPKNVNPGSYVKVTLQLHRAQAQLSMQPIQ